jgi:cytochrome c2
VLVALAACSPSSPPHATAADASRANVALAELEHGRAILVRKCGNCHKAPRPGDDWQPHMPEMAVRANLDAEQQRLIVQYLTVMAYTP